MNDTLPQERFHRSDFVERLVRIRRDLHRHPELGFQETRTAGLVQARLEELGIPSRSQIAGTGVLGSIQGGRPGPTLLLRADMDALPLQELSEVPYRSVYDGKMHACGHDAHVAILLGAAEVLQENREQLPGRVQLCFQPAEEGPGGAAPMIEAGVLRDPGVDMALGLHVWSEIPRGEVALVPGPFMASTDSFECRILARGGHGAAPHRTPDPVLTAAQVMLAWQTVLSRELDPLQPAVLSVCSIHGGTACNIIPHEVVLRGTVRTFDDTVREAIPAAMERILAGTTRAQGCRGEFRWEPLYPALVNHPELTQRLGEVVEGMAGRLRHQVEPAPCMGGEDMAFFLREVPGCYLFLGAGDPEAAETVPHHSPHFDIDERCLPLGAELLVRGTWHFLAGGPPAK